MRLPRQKQLHQQEEVAEVVEDSVESTAEQTEKDEVEEELPEADKENVEEVQTKKKYRTLKQSRKRSEDL